MNRLHKLFLGVGLLAILIAVAAAFGPAGRVSAAPKVALYGVNCSGVSSYWSLVQDSGLKTFVQGARTVKLEAAQYAQYRSSDNAWCGAFESWHSGYCSGSPCLGLMISWHQYVQQTDGSWLSVQSGSWNLASVGVTETRTSAPYRPVHCAAAFRTDTSVSGTGTATTPTEFC